MGTSVELKLSVIIRYTFSNAQLNVQSAPHPSPQEFFSAKINYALSCAPSPPKCSITGTNQMSKFQKKRFPYSNVKKIFPTTFKGNISADSSQTHGAEWRQLPKTYKNEPHFSIDIFKKVTYSF